MFMRQVFRSCAYHAVRRKALLIGPGLVSAVSLTGEAKPDEAKKPVLQPPDPSSLSYQSLIKNAANSTVEAASTMYMHTMYSLLDVHKKYAEVMERLLQLMELNLQVMGQSYREDQVWDAMLDTRAQLSVLKQERQSLQQTLDFAEKTLRSAADAAFITGAEAAMQRAMGTMDILSFELEQLSKKNSDLEKKMASLEVETISETAKRTDPEKIKKMKEQLEDIDSEEIS